ncbi:MAG: hypothetical protein ACTSWY_04985 [Promethearchaeota archaeon]
MINEFRATFNFIQEDIKLSAVVDKDTGKQTLIMQKLNKNGDVEFQDQIDCIHTVITDISPENYKNLKENSGNNKNLIKKNLRIRSVEGLKHINLTPEEKFKAFKMWVAGIAEAGFDAFKIQSQIEQEGKLIIPITFPLMQFLASIDAVFMLEYIGILEKECVYEGELHKSSLISNLSPILHFIRKNNNISDGDKNKILKAIFQLNPPIDLFIKETKNMMFLEHISAIVMENFPLFFSQTRIVRKHIIKNPKITIFPEFSKFLSAKTEPNFRIRKQAAEIIKATKFNEYINFLSIKTEPDQRIRKAAAKNEKAVKFKEYRNFLDFKTEPISEIRKIAARNTEAGKIKEYINFLSAKTEPNFEVRVIAASNFHAQKKIEYENLFSDPIDDVREAAHRAKNKSISKNVTLSKSDFEEYAQIKVELEELRKEFEINNQELIFRIKKMEEYLFPPGEKLDDEVIRELKRLKSISISGNKKEEQENTDFYNNTNSVLKSKKRQ